MTPYLGSVIYVVKKEQPTFNVGSYRGQEYFYSRVWITISEYIKVIIMDFYHPLIEYGISGSNIQYWMLAFLKVNSVLLSKKHIKKLQTTMLALLLMYKI